MMLHLVYDWSHSGRDLFVPCPGCGALRVTSRGEFDKDGCGLLLCCGTAVRLDGFKWLAPLPTVTAH